jgi:hypothetical protein
MITAHKKLYENHTGDLTALKKLYDHYAKDCVRVAELTVDPRRREQYLKLASEWTEAAAALRVCIDEIDAAEDARKFNSHIPSVDERNRSNPAVRLKGRSAWFPGGRWSPIPRPRADRSRRPRQGFFS